MIDNDYVAIADIAIKIPPIRMLDKSLGKVLSDIDSHMPAGHQYRDNDRITWSHETSHGLSSRIRNKNSLSSEVRTTGYMGKAVEVPFEMINAFYVLNDNAVLIAEPNTTIRTVAPKVPKKLRGDVYDLYLIRQARDWDDRPLYLFDEWNAYTNGAATRYDLKIKNRGETVQYMLEFIVYSFCVAWVSPTPEEQQFKKFLRWQTERCMQIFAANDEIKNSGKTLAYMQTLQQHLKDDELGEFMDNYMGKLWVDVTLRGLMGIL